ncbi:MAG: rod shape-determining protein MreC [Lentisphaeria bacterium]|nr:rod shape-determining protein MreC [Lentisphaeria bacterium]
MKKRVQKWIFLLPLAGILILWLGAAYHSFALFVNRAGNDYFAPYLKLGTFLKDGAEDLSLTALDKDALVRLVKGLQAENHVLTSQSLLLTELQRQNEELRKMVNLPLMPDWKRVPAEIILRDPAQWLYSFTISKGSRSGIRKGCAVFTIDAKGTPLLLGQVFSVSKYSAKVLSIYHKDLHLSGRLNISRATCLINSTVQSAADHYLLINYLPRDLKYINDEEVFTGGFERNVPPGLKIGNLINVDKEPSIFSNQLYINGWIKPAADFNDLRFVYVAVPDEISRAAERTTP